MLADASGATADPDGLSVRFHKPFTRAAKLRTLVARFTGEGEMRKVCALLLFVLGESVLASLSFGVAALPALITFVAGSALMVRGTWP